MAIEDERMRLVGFSRNVPYVFEMVEAPDRAP
jgi:hypothetical protein